MCDTLRNTRSRGRSGVPAIRLRCRSPMRTRRSFFVLIFIVSSQSAIGNRQSVNPQSTIGNPQLLGASLPRLLLQHFTGVADALLLVGIRPAQPADVGRDLADG